MLTEPILYAQGGPSRTGGRANVLFFDRKPAAELDTLVLFILDRAFKGEL